LSNQVWIIHLYCTLLLFLYLDAEIFIHVSSSVVSNSMANSVNAFFNPFISFAAIISHQCTWPVGYSCDSTDRDPLLLDVIPAFLVPLPRWVFHTLPTCFFNHRYFEKSQYMCFVNAFLRQSESLGKFHVYFAFNLCLGLCQHKIQIVDYASHV